MHVLTFFFGALLVNLACWTPAEGLKCVCKQEDCAPLPDCKWGSGEDVCKCCQVCRQGPGEECGGPWNIRGQCGVGLECRSENSKFQNSVGVCEWQEPKA